MAAYYEHAARLGFTDTAITDFMPGLALATISIPMLSRMNC